jgi:hypothetical protein
MVDVMVAIVLQLCCLCHTGARQNVEVWLDSESFSLMQLFGALKNGASF